MSGESSEYFEYDEGLESDEGFEADEADEGFESDEADEADEGFESDEADEGDEGFHFSEADEADESDESDESDEADESYGPGYAARIRARARAQQLDWQRSVIQMQQDDARRARAAQRLTSQRIQNAARAKTQTLKPVRGAGVVTLQLPGRPPLRAMMRPAPALAADVNRLRQVLANNDARQARALARLGAAQAAGFKRLTDRQLQNERDLAKKMVQGDSNLSQLIAKESAERKLALDKQRKRFIVANKNANRRNLCNLALLGTSAPLWALYADRSKLTAPRNIKFLASNAVWLYADEIFGSVMGRRHKMATANLAWLSVAGNIATMLYLAKDEQHQRFVHVTTTLTGGSADLSAADLGIAKDYQDDFEAFPEVRAVATYVDTATVENEPILTSWNNKRLTVKGTPGAKVAIVVDTWKDNGDL
jgi:hypothetical protein